MSEVMERPTAVEPMTPAAIAAATEIRRKAPIKAGHLAFVTQNGHASPTNTSERAIGQPHPIEASPLAGYSPFIDNFSDVMSEVHNQQIRDAASATAQPSSTPPHHEKPSVFSAIGHQLFGSPPHHEPIPYTPDPALAEIIDDIRDTHRLRQNMIRAQMRLELQAQATIRLPAMSDADFADDDAKAAAKKRVAELYAAIKKAGPSHELYANIAPFIAAQGPLEEMRGAYEKRMVKLAKQLPAYAWAKSVKGLGDISFATLVGECGDIGSYKSVAAVWKRLGLAVMDGKRQGAPGESASADDWIAHGYSGKRRSVSWNARNQIIGGMGLWRPAFGDDVQLNEELTEYQRVFAERARYEAEKLGLPVKESAKGKESYSKHVVNRAMRYTEKRMLKHLYLAWRRGGAL